MQILFKRIFFCRALASWKILTHLRKEDHSWVFSHSIERGSHFPPRTAQALPRLAHLLIYCLHFLPLLSSGRASSLAVPEPSVPPSSPSVHLWPRSSCRCCLEGSLPRKPLGSSPSSLFRLREGHPNHSGKSIHLPLSSSFSSAFSVSSEPLPPSHPVLKANVQVVHLINLLNPGSDPGGAWDSAHLTPSQVPLMLLVQASDSEKQGSNSL